MGGELFFAGQVNTACPGHKPDTGKLQNSIHIFYHAQYPVPAAGNQRRYKKQGSI
jgi:hypothetical protein